MAELPSPRPSALVVGIGASAGGLAAFKRFLASTPADTGMAFVLVQHLDPHHKSLLVELLGAHSPIPVVTVKDGLIVKENCVFVIPPDATLTIRDGVLRLTTPAPAREHRRPIDTFFTSLAEDCGERAVAFVLVPVSEATAQSASGPSRSTAASPWRRPRSMPRPCWACRAVLSPPVSSITSCRSKPCRASSPTITGI